MDPFGNFGWNFGFGFGWIMIGITVMLIVLAITQLVRFSTKDDRASSQDLNDLKKLKQDICSGKISIEEFDEKMKSRA
jgi:uncharacterized membrane protein